jgi:predicted GNAT superfamily acetyltransferase
VGHRFGREMVIPVVEQMNRWITRDGWSAREGQWVRDAPTSAGKQGIRIRMLEQAQEMSVCVELQQRIWGYAPIDTVPDQIFIVAKKTGGQVMTAYHGDTPVGFTLAFAAMREGLGYLHSHMVGVVEEYQNRGIGRLLKLAQREDALERGIRLIEWTFDPLQLKNAHFNIERLGAIVRRYIPNLYGRTSSPLHAGMPTDRLVAEWWVRSERVAEVLGGRVRSMRTDGERIAIPAGIRAICRDQPLAAEKMQTKVREQFLANIAMGRAAVGFEFNEEQGTYLLERYED